MVDRSKTGEEMSGFQMFGIWIVTVVLLKQGWFRQVTGLEAVFE